MTPTEPDVRELIRQLDAFVTDTRMSVFKVGEHINLSAIARAAFIDTEVRRRAIKIDALMETLFNGRQMPVTSYELESLSESRYTMRLSRVYSDSKYSFTITTKMGVLYTE